MTPTEKSLLVDGLKVHYWEGGDPSQRNLLLIHGGLGDARQHWEASIGLLAEQYHVLAPDLPGFGGSDPLPRLRLDVMLHWMKSFIDAHKMEQTVLVGHAFGGLMVRLFAAVNPRYVPVVVLVNGGSVPDAPPALKFIQRIPVLSTLLFNNFARSLLSETTLKQLFHNIDAATPAFRQNALAASPAYARLLQMLVGSEIPAERNPLVPTLLIWGQSDQFTPLSEGEVIKASIPGSTLRPIVECGHFPQLEAAEVFAWQVDTFLTELSKPATPSRGGPKQLRNLSG